MHVVDVHGACLIERGLSTTTHPLNSHAQTTNILITALRYRLIRSIVESETKIIGDINIA